MLLCVPQPRLLLCVPALSAWPWIYNHLALHLKRSTYDDWPFSLSSYTLCTSSSSVCSFPTPPPGHCENKGQFSSTPRLDLMEYLGHGDGAVEGKGLARHHSVLLQWARSYVYVPRACLFPAHVKNCMSPLCCFARLLSCAGIYSDVVMLFWFLHVTHALWGHMERERERGRVESLAIKN